MTAETRRARFHELHAREQLFVMPNPWDVGSARILAALGFEALATTSAGFAWSVGKADNAVTVDQVLGHLKKIATTVSLPVNADFEGGYARDPQGVAANVERAVSTGVAGLSIEDSTGDKNAPLFDFGLAVERIRAARAAIDKTRSGVVLTGRSEGFFVGKPDIKGAGFDRWEPPFRQMGGFPHVWCKLSGLVTEADWHAWTPAELRPYIETALEAFGPSRLMFGSDWPVCTLAAPYRDVLHLVETAIGPLSDAERELVLGGTARAFWDL